MLKIDMKYRKGRLIVEIKGSLNRFNGYKLNDYLVPVILKHNIKQLIYDTSNLQGLDNYGLKVLKNGIIAVRNNKGSVVFSKNSKIILNEG